MRRAFVFSMILFCAVTAARAEAPAPAEAPEPEPAWSLGAGIGGSSFVRGTLTNVRQRDTLVLDAEVGNSPTVFVEHRLAHSLWLIGRATFDYTSKTEGPMTTASGNNNDKTKSVSTSLDGTFSLGLRGVLASTKRVQMSAFGMVGFGLTRLQQKSVNVDGSESNFPPDESNGYNVGGSFGVACDAFLLPHVALRLSTPLVGVTYTATKEIQHQNISANELETFTSPTTTITGGLRISPSLEVRILF